MCVHSFFYVLPEIWKKDLLGMFSIKYTELGYYFSNLMLNLEHFYLLNNVESRLVHNVHRYFTVFIMFRCKTLRDVCEVVTHLVILCASLINYLYFVSFANMSWGLDFYL